MPRGARGKDNIQANSFINLLRKKLKRRSYGVVKRSDIIKETGPIFFGEGFTGKTTVNEEILESFKRYRQFINVPVNELNKLINKIMSLAPEEITAGLIAQTLFKLGEIYEESKLKAEKAKVEGQMIKLTADETTGAIGILSDQLIIGYINDYNATQRQNLVKTPTEAMNLMKNPTALGQLSLYGTAFLSWFLYRAGFSTSFPVVLGPVALKHCDEIEVARSGKVLKFRATGSVFLAGQKSGGKDSVVIRGNLLKWEIIEILMLWGLFAYGQGKQQSFDSQMLFGKLPTSKLRASNVDFSQIRKLTDVRVLNENLQEMSYEFHATFPVVTRHFIIPNCYIETFSFEEKLPLKDTLQYSILLRTYEHHDSYDLYQKTTNKGKVVGPAYIGTSPGKTTAQRLSEFAINIAWRWLGAKGIWVEGHEWKLGDAKKAGELDTYYNVGFESIASAMFLGLAGKL